MMISGMNTVTKNQALLVTYGLYHIGKYIIVFLFAEASRLSLTLLLYKKEPKSPENKEFFSSFCSCSAGFAFKIQRKLCKIKISGCITVERYVQYLHEKQTHAI